MSHDRIAGRATGVEERLLRDELLLSHREQTRLRLQAEQLVSSNRDLSTLLLSAERRVGELLKMAVAIRRLLEAENGYQALRAVEEVLVNVIGTEDFVILALAPDGKSLLPIGGVGHAHERAREHTIGVDDFSDFPHSGGRLIVASPPAAWGGDTPTLAACIPLRIRERVVGVILIHRLLPHRDALNAFDDELLTLLGDVAATIILAADQRRQWTCLQVSEA